MSRLEFEKPVKMSDGPTTELGSISLVSSTLPEPRGGLGVYKSEKYDRNKVDTYIDKNIEFNNKHFLVKLDPESQEVVHSFPIIEGAEEPVLVFERNLQESQFRAEVEKVIRENKRLGTFRKPDSFHQVMNQIPAIIARYDNESIYKIPIDTKDEMTRKIITRAVLDFGDDRLRMKDYKNAAEAVRELGTQPDEISENFRLLWNEEFGSGLKLFQEIEMIQEDDSDGVGVGTYWREAGNEPQHLKVRGLGSTLGVDNVREALDTATEFQRLFGFASYCSSQLNPLRDITVGNDDRLLLEDILDEVDDSRASTGENKPENGYSVYFLDQRYLDQLWYFYGEADVNVPIDPNRNLRDSDNLVTVNIRDPKAHFLYLRDGILSSKPKDPAGQALKLIDPSITFKGIQLDDYEKKDAGIIKADWLRFIANPVTLPFMDYIHLNGFRKPSELFKFIEKDPLTGEGESVPTIPYYYAVLLQGAGECPPLMRKVLNRPLPAPVSKDKFPPQEMVKPFIIPFLQKVQEYLSLLDEGDRSMPFRSYRFLESIINYARVDNKRQRSTESLEERKNKFWQDHFPRADTRFEIATEPFLADFLSTSYTQKLVDDLNTSYTKAAWGEAFHHGKKSLPKAIWAAFRIAVEKLES